MILSNVPRKLITTDSYYTEFLAKEMSLTPTNLFTSFHDRSFTISPLKEYGFAGNI